MIDDDPQTAAIVRQWLRDEPFEILEARDGEAGLALAARHNPDVILLDLRLPGADGISVARRLKGDGRTRNVPLILLTACRDLESKVEAFAAGADDYVTKPFEFAELDARIRSMLRRREALMALEATVHDLTSTNEQLELRLMVDEKTGLYNFREFQRRLREEWERAERYATPLSLVFLDVDHFKQVNDRWGHPAGDRVLREFATLVAGGARTSDFAARYGGEEFAIVLPHTDAPMALRVAERIRLAVRDFRFLRDESPTRITVSAGVATYPSTPGLDSVDALVRAADAALYRAKDLGRDRVVGAAETR
ncbi:MAG TPA: diguanylate cyclase [Candidatus Polarisedimenticolaceae bacterium]|nr:diguanylate cyclase [Candidatus Polarisedimenticolaceae bacterium]